MFSGGRNDRDYGRSNSNNRRSRSRSRDRDRRTRRRSSSRERRRERDYRRGSPSDYAMEHDDYDRSYHRDNKHRTESRESRRDRDKSYAKRNYSPHRSNDADDDDYDSHDSDSGDRYASQTPYNKIIVRGLAQHITEADISSDLIQYGLKPLSIRLIRKRKTGASRGFAFVEFSTEEEATRWMEYKQGILMLQDHYRAVMQYSISKGPLPYSGGSNSSSSRDKYGTDWYCAKCLVFNFKRRENCFKCYASREESEKGGEGSDEISNVLTKKIMLRNLDVLTNEEGVLTAMQSLVPELVSKISKILVCRDPLTNTSRGICYLTFDNLVDSMNIHNALKAATPLNIDGREVAVTYCVDGVSEGGSGGGTDVPHNQPHAKGGATRNAPSMSHNNSSNSSGQSAATAVGGSSSVGADTSYKYTADDVPRLAEYSANLYASNDTEREHYVKYYTQYYVGLINEGQFASLPTMSQLNQSQTANSGAAVAQSAIQRKNVNRRSNDSSNMSRLSGSLGPNASSSTRPMHVPSGSDGRKYPVPDVAQFQYDETSGYYYDASTGLYYDAHSQYYYNTSTNSYLYYDSIQRTYIAAPSAEQKTVTGSENTNSSFTANESSDALAGEKNKGGERTDKVKVAKKIVKDMEKWAKQLNQKKDMGGVMQLPVPVKEEHPLQRQSHYGSSTSNGYADVGFSILEKKDSKVDESLSLAKANSMSSASASGGNSKLVAAYGSDSDDAESGDGRASDKDFVDFEKLTCLLCKRAFQSLDILNKHLKMSNLHKENMQKHNLTSESSESAALSYRDRAKERRLKYGEADPPPINRNKERFQKHADKQSAASAMSSSISMAAPIGESNMGNRLLQKMGWQEGQGLGRSNQGRTNIIEVNSRSGQTAGLGNKQAAPPFVGGDYKTYIKRMMKSRYEQVEGNDD